MDKRSIIDDLMDPEAIVEPVISAMPVDEVVVESGDIGRGRGQCVERDCSPKIRNPETNCCIDPSGRVAARLRKMQLLG
jgi:hypothetical protein